MAKRARKTPKNLNETEEAKDAAPPLSEATKVETVSAPAPTKTENCPDPAADKPADPKQDVDVTTAVEAERAEEAARLGTDQMFERGVAEAEADLNRDTLGKERDALDSEANSLRVARAALDDERARLAEERTALEGEKRMIAEQRNAGDRSLEGSKAKAAKLVTEGKLDNEPTKAMLAEETANANNSNVLPGGELVEGATKGAKETAAEADVKSGEDKPKRTRAPRKTAAKKTAAKTAPKTAATTATKTAAAKHAEK